MDRALLFYVSSAYVQLKDSHVVLTSIASIKGEGEADVQEKTLGIEAPVAASVSAGAVYVPGEKNVQKLRAEPHDASRESPAKMAGKPSGTPICVQAERQAPQMVAVSLSACTVPYA